MPLCLIKLILLLRAVAIQMEQLLMAALVTTLLIHSTTAQQLPPGPSVLDTPTTPTDDPPPSPQSLTSSFNCTEDALHRVCQYTNLVLYRSEFYLLTDEDPPAVQNTWLEDAKGLIADHMGMFKPHVVSRESPMHLQILGHMSEAAFVDRGLVWLASHTENYGHMLGEDLPNMHITLCRNWGLCTASEADRDLHVVTTNRHDGLEYPSAVLEALGAISQYPLVRSGHHIFQNATFVFGRALAGFGDECKAFVQCSRFSKCSVCTRHSPEAFLMRSWKVRMLEYLGLERLPAASAPIVLLVNRFENKGRYMRNLDDTAVKIRETFPHVLVEVIVPGNLSLSDQARHFRHADVIVMAHGAAMGNIVFLKQGARLIEVVPISNSHHNEWSKFSREEYGFEWDLIHLQPQRTQMRASFSQDIEKDVYRTHWDAVKPDARALFIEQGICPPDNGYCINHWALKYSVIDLDWSDVYQAMHLTPAISQ